MAHGVHCRSTACVRLTASVPWLNNYVSVRVVDLLKLSLTHSFEVVLRDPDSIQQLSAELRRCTTVQSTRNDILYHDILYIQTLAFTFTFKPRNTVNVQYKKTWKKVEIRHKFLPKSLAAQRNRAIDAPYCLEMSLFVKIRKIYHLASNLLPHY